MGETLSNAGHEIRLETGLRAYPLPEFGKQNPRVGWESIIPPTAGEAEVQLNELLALIEKQGGSLIGTISVGVSITEEPGTIGSESAREPKTFLIIKK